MSVPENPVERIILHESREIFRRAFSGYAVNTLLAVVTSWFIAILPFLGIPPSYLTPFQVLGVAVALYSGIVYWRFRKNSSTGFAGHCYVLAVLGFSLAATPAVLLGGLLFSFAGYEMASIGYYLRRVSKRLPLQCGRDGGEVAVFGNNSLVCLKCSRLFKVGFDIPILWRNVGFAALAIGVTLRIIVPLISVPILGILIIPAGLLIVNGLVVALSQLIIRGVFQGKVRLPPAESQQVPPRPDQ
jgi:hypothetical protein